MAWLDDQFDTAWADDGVFDRLKDTITWWIQGDPNNTVSIQADVDWEVEPGTNEAPGEGRQIVDQTGIPLLRTCLIEVDRSIVGSLRPERDEFLLADGDRVVFVRVLGRDGSTATIFCQRSESVSRKLTRPRQ